MKVRLKHSGNLHFIGSARDFEDIHIDEPESFHGNNLGPSPIEYFLIGIGGCISTTFMYCLQKNNVEIEKLEVIVDGQLKHNGLKLNLKLVDINVELLITYKMGQSDEKIDLCEKVFQEYCPLSDLITNGVPLNVKISRI
ncbi:MAG: OsmC family protein [Promethearchaeota archaeon]